MKLLLDSVTKDLKPWIEAFKIELGDENVITYDQVSDPDEIATAVVWNHRPELFRELKNIKLIASLGAGVDHILSDESIPSDARISRIISPILSEPMSNYCIGAVLYYKKQFDKYAADKLLKNWDQEFEPERDLKVGILGFGELGSDLGVKLKLLGFEVHGLSRTRKRVDEVITYDESQMDTFLSEINVLICMLPATKATKGILSKSLFDKMKMGSFLINVARGHHQIDQDIIEALDSQRLSGAFLDVFPQEPLPLDNALWTHPKVFITPHIAVVTKMEAAVPQILANHRAIMSGGSLTGLVDRNKGY